MNKAAFWNGFGNALQPILKFCDRTAITGKVRPRQAVLPLPHTSIAAFSTAEVDNALQRLDEHKQKWVLVDTKQRAALLTACLKNFMTLAKDMAVAGTSVKGSYEGGIGDEM
jgi:acyl-CoA reductase-like NAD-dependent aldehyde dehydrogenase